MSLFRRAPARRVETRATAYQQFWGSGADQVRLSNPLSLVPLFAAHRLIVDAVATTPLHAYRTAADGTSQKAPRQPALLEKPLYCTPSTWKAKAVSSLLYDGNAFGLVTARGSDGWPTSLVWLDPRAVLVETNDRDGGPDYFLDRRPIDRADMVHIPWIAGLDDWRGLSPVAAFRLTLETGHYAQTTARDWFSNGAVPSGHMKNTQLQLDPAQTDELKARFKASVSGREVLLTGNDWEYTTIGIPADQAQFLDTLKLTATQIAAIYGVPAEQIGGETGESMTYKTLESDELRFNARVKAPWCIRIEEALSGLMPRPLYAKFNLDASVRVDLLTRYQAHEIGIRTGVETVDEARRLEDKPPLTPAEKEELAAKTAPAPASEPDPEGDPDGSTD